MKSLGEVLLNQTVKDQAEKFSRMFENAEMNFSDDEFKKLNWKEESYTANKDDLTFIGSETLPDEISNLQIPFQFWSYLVNDDIITHLVEQTNIYATQSKKKQLNVTISEMKRFIRQRVLIGLSTGFRRSIRH